MANIIYMTIKGQKQGLISAGCSGIKSIGNKYQSGHEDEIFVLALINHMTRNENVSLHPIEVHKPVDKSTPLLAQAINDNEKMDCTFSLYRTAQTGGNELYFRITLTEATLCDIRLHCPNSVTHNDAQPYESISFKYASVTWEHVMAGTSAYSIWDERVL